jgi:hypothetical protein
LAIFRPVLGKRVAILLYEVAILAALTWVLGKHMATLPTRR